MNSAKRREIAATEMRAWAGLAPEMFQKDLIALAERLAAAENPDSLREDLAALSWSVDPHTPWEQVVEQILDRFGVILRAINSPYDDAAFLREMAGEFLAQPLMTRDQVASRANAKENGGSLRFIPYGPYDPRKEAQAEHQSRLLEKMAVLGHKIRVLAS